MNAVGRTHFQYDGVQEPERPAGEIGDFIALQYEHLRQGLIELAVKADVLFLTAQSYESLPSLFGKWLSLCVEEIIDKAHASRRDAHPDRCESFVVTACDVTDTLKRHRCEVFGFGCSGSFGTWSPSLAPVLQQLHPDYSLSAGAFAVMNDLMTSLLQRIVTQAQIHQQVCIGAPLADDIGEIKNQTLGKRCLMEAVRTTLAGKLCKVAMYEALHPQHRQPAFSVEVVDALGKKLPGCGISLTRVASQMLTVAPP